MYTYAAYSWVKLSCHRTSLKGYIVFTPQILIMLTLVGAEQLPYESAERYCRTHELAVRVVSNTLLIFFEHYDM